MCIDRLAPSSLQVGAAAATRNVHRFDQACAGSLRRALRRIRSRDARNGILVIAEGVSSVTSQIADLALLQEICREHAASLLPSVAHDLGSMGDDATGTLGMQGMLGKIDLVVGSSSHAFTCNGGFLAMKDRRLAEHLRSYCPPFACSSAISPLQCAVVISALRVIRSDEGQRRREQLCTIVERLRRRFAARGIECSGVPSPIVSVAMPEGDRLARVTAALAFRNGLFANLVECSAGARGRPRFHLQAMATHTEHHVDKAVSVLSSAMDAARVLLDSGREAGFRSNRSRGVFPACRHPSSWFNVAPNMRIS